MNRPNAKRPAKLLLILLARLKARPNPYTAGDTGLAACAGEAATARELFGDSAEAYVELAAEADQLRDQVSGLQQFATDVCRAGQTLEPQID